MRRLGLSVLAAATVGWAAAPARANARLETEEQRVSSILQSTLVAHGAEVHRCFEKALADTMEIGGKVELAVDVGAEGKVTKAAPAVDEAGSPVLLACLETSAVTWTFAGIDPGSTVIVPLDFEGQAAQFTVKAADAPERGPGAAGAKSAKGVGKPGAPPPFSIKLLVDEKTMRARQASMSLLTVSPANRIAMHKHPGAEILYVLKGHARILSQPGTLPERLDEGMAIFIPGGTPHAIENMGRQTPAVMLDYFVPMGPERVFRDPTDPVGRAGFEVLHGAPTIPATGLLPPVKWGLATASKVEPITLTGGKARVRKLLTAENTGSGAAYLGVLEADPGAQIPRHVHPTSAELLYVVSGTGVVTVGVEPIPFGPDTAIHIPEGQPHIVNITGPDKAIMIQLYAPAGPEQRFVGGAAAPERHAVNFALDDGQLVLQKSVRELAERLIVPNARRWDKEEVFPHEVIPAMGEMGLLGMQIPEEYGGAGMKFLDYVVALEEISRADASVGLTMASHNSLCTGHIYLAGNEAQRKKYLPRLASGQALGGWGLTEPGSGSDAGAAATRAIRKNAGWVINGTKTFITQGSVGSIYVVLASTSPEKKAKGLTAFIVERGTPGFRTGKRIEKMGLHASDTTELVFEEVEIPDDQRLGEIDAGFFDTLKILDKGRVGIGAWAVGIGRAALEASLKYAKERVQFGKPISDFQGIQHMLADMATELDAARLLVWRAALMQDQKLRTTQESATAKYYAARATMRACNAAVQIHGGYGYTREFDVERYLRDAKLGEIGEGTNEVQKMVIARELLKGA